jgi:hypothetical protein
MEGMMPSFSLLISDLLLSIAAFETEIRANYKVAPGSTYKQFEGTAPGAYRRFWDNMYWVLSSFPALKCPIRISDEFNKKDMLFADCLKIGFDLLPEDHAHKDFLKFVLEDKAEEFRQQARIQLELPGVKSNLKTRFQEAGYDHYFRAFTQCNGTIAVHEWNNVWLLLSIGPKPEFSGWKSFNLDRMVKDYVMKNISPELLEEEEDDDDF